MSRNGDGGAVDGVGSLLLPVVESNEARAASDDVFLSLLASLA